MTSDPFDMLFSAMAASYKSEGLVQVETKGKPLASESKKEAKAVPAKPAGKASGPVIVLPTDKIDHHDWTALYPKVGCRPMLVDGKKVIDKKTGLPVMVATGDPRVKIDDERDLIHRFSPVGYKFGMPHGPQLEQCRRDALTAIRLEKGQIEGFKTSDTVKAYVAGLPDHRRDVVGKALAMKEKAREAGEKACNWRRKAENERAQKTPNNNFIDLCNAQADMEQERADSLDTDANAMFHSVNIESEELAR